MPEICRFHGIRVFIWFYDHGLPHFHAWYGDARAVVEIQKLIVKEGRLPRNVTRRLLAWAGDHQDELLDAWDASQAGEMPEKIAPPER